MDVPFWLSRAQMRRIEPFFPLSHGIPKVDDRRIVSGIVYVIKHGLMRRYAPKGYGPHKTIYNRFIRWSRLGVFNRIFPELGGQAGEPDALMIDATHLKAHRTAASLLKGGLFPEVSGAQGWTELQTSCRLRWAGQAYHPAPHRSQMSDHKGVALLLSSLPKAKVLLGDKGYDSDWFRAALASQGIAACIPPKANRKVQYHYNKQHYRQRNKIENLFGRIKDWRRVATRYDRCPHTFMSAISIAATLCYWL